MTAHKGWFRAVVLACAMLGAGAAGLLVPGASSALWRSCRCRGALTRHTAVALLAIALLATGCGERSTKPAASSPTAPSSPETIGTATLAETGCQVDVPDHLPLHSVTFKLVNNTRYSPGRFILIHIHSGHTYQDLISYEKSGQAGAPDFISEISLVDVPSKSSGQMVTRIPYAGVYAFDCGYPDDTGRVVGFTHGPFQAGTS